LSASFYLCLSGYSERGAGVAAHGGEQHAPNATGATDANADADITSLGATTNADIYFALYDADAGDISECSQYAASRAGVLLHMVQPFNVVIQHDVGSADDEV